MKRSFARLLMVLAGLGAALAAAEGVLRTQLPVSTVPVLDPPGIKYARSDPSETRGWVETRPPTAPVQGVARVVAVGDSLTYGVSVAPNEAWPARLSALLGPQVEVLNFGTAGYDAEQIATLMEARVPAWEPDLVVWGAYINDGLPSYLLHDAVQGRPLFVGSWIPPEARVLPLGPSLWLVRHSAAARLLHGALFARAFSDLRGPVPYEGWLEAQLDRIAAVPDAPLVLGLAPHVLADPKGCTEQAPFPAYCAGSKGEHRRIGRGVQDRGLQWVDGLAPLQASGQPHFHPESGPDPDHPNAQGHELIAQALLEPVRQALTRRARSEGSPQ